MSEAKNAEAELAKVIEKNSGLAMWAAKKLAGVILAAGYAKREDVIEKCWLKALGDETNSTIPMELAANKDAMRGIEFITLQIANSIRSLKGQP